MRGRRRTGIFLAAVTSLVPCTGCSSTEDSSASSAATRFYAAVRAGDGAAACALLAPTTRSELEQSTGRACIRAVLQEVHPMSGPPEHVQVYDTMAQARFATDTVFLTRISDGWTVLAVTCTPQSRGRPYDCQVKGG